MKAGLDPPTRADLSHLRSTTSLPESCARRVPPLTLLALAALGLLCTLFVTHSVVNLFYPFPINIGEGTILSSSWLSATGEPFYTVPDKPPYVLTIYNPFFIQLSALALRLFGPGPYALRVLSLGFFLGSAFLIYRFVRRETGSVSAALIAGLFLLVERHTYSRAAYGVVDFSALFLSLLGLCLWRTGGRGRYFALVSFALAFFSKQTSLAAACAAFASLFLDGKRGKSFGFLACFLALVALGLALCGVLYGRAYFLNAFVYATRNPFYPHRGIMATATAVCFYAVPVAGWLFLCVRALREKRHLLPVLYVLFAFAPAFASGKMGANRGYFFDFAAGISIMVGLLWARVAAREALRRITFPVVTAVVLQLLLAALATTYGISPVGQRDPSRFEDANELESAFASHKGMVFCRWPGFDVEHGSRNVSNDLYQLHILTTAGVFPEEMLLAPLRERVYTLVIVSKKEPTWKLFKGSVLDTVKEHYELAHQSEELEFYVPPEPGGS
ncbi:MAG: hypothetical protein ACYTAN_05855 [Planctomycetota bacterium]